eukprot:TRINITY_DN4214_c0_g1_i1.p1 TRINITY_DN4214_c0_g1~~TRINITY_DN4214_c0_g1_i1.p1  ORF type:complete len:231 (+),score=69.04 TRINITY_DN4214_c0_g1_i1:15-707(+)
MLNLVSTTILLAAAAAAQDVCYSHVESKCSEPGESWTEGQCTSVHGGFLGNTNNLHRIIVDDFTDSISYLLMASTFNTDKKNHLGFHKYFMDKSDKMWARGKGMMEYVLKRGGKMGNAFQIPPLNSANSLSDLDYSNEMKSLAVSVDLLKKRAEDSLHASMHAFRKSDKQADRSNFSFDPTTSHLLEELSEEYSNEIRETSEKLNTLGRMVKKDNSRNMALHLFDQMLKA